MVNFKKKRQSYVYNTVKCLYEEKILTYDLTYKNVLSYTRTYQNIVVMLESIKASRSAIKYQLGDEFEKWFFEVHAKIIGDFWSGCL